MKKDSSIEVDIICFMLCISLKQLLELRQKRAQQQQALKFTTSQAHPRLEEISRLQDKRAPGTFNNI